MKDKDLCPKNLWTTRDQGNDDQRIYDQEVYDQGVCDQRIYDQDNYDQGVYGQEIYDHGIYEQQMIIVCPGAGPERGNQPGYCCAGIFISVFYRVS